jgi:hypothetical protein
VGFRGLVFRGPCGGCGDDVRIEEIAGSGHWLDNGDGLMARVGWGC